MKARIYYMRGKEERQFVVDDRRSFRAWANDISVSMSAGGMFVGNDFAFPTRNIYYIEKLED